VPGLLAYRGSPEMAAERGTVLLYHGFSGAKERVEYYSTALAEAGFLAVSLDAIGHGERRWPDFDVIFNDERWDEQFDATEADFLKLIDDTAAEVPSIIDDLRGPRLGPAGPDRHRRSFARRQRGLRVGSRRHPRAGGRIRQ
jgi:fermentation-respiration switch protein FrsA (DUF1100 family)